MSERQQELSISFTPEEVDVLAAMCGHPSPRLMDQAGTGDDATRALLRDAALRSLQARGVVADDLTTLATAVARLIDLVCRPALRVDVYVDDLAGARQGRARYGANPAAAIEQRDRSGVEQFTPFATPDLLARVASRTELSGEGAESPASLRAGGSGGSVNLGALRSAITLAAGGSGVTDAELATVLGDGGLDSAAAGALAAALRSATRIVSVRVDVYTGPGQVQGGELRWLDSPEGRWLLPAVDAPYAAPQPSAAEAPTPWAAPLADQSVEVAPVDADELLRLLHSVLPAPQERPGNA